jgi:hypothetical protein
MVRKVASRSDKSRHPFLKTRPVEHLGIEASEPLHQFDPSHPLGDDVADDSSGHLVGDAEDVDDPSLLPHPAPEAGADGRVEHVQRYRRQIGFVDETDMVVEHIEIIVIESADHGPPHGDAVGEDSVNLLHQIALEVVVFSHLLQGLLIGRFDTDEHLIEVGLGQ